MTFSIPYSFIAGEKARSAEVNANFSYLESALNNETDNTTISRNSSTNKLSAIGVTDSNAGGAVKTWLGTQQQYTDITTKDNNTVYYITDTGSVYVGNALISTKGSRHVGEIVASVTPLTDGSLHLLDGAILSGDGVYADFVNHMIDLYQNTSNPNFFTTEADWQASVTSYGVCGKFVYTPASGSDPATIRLPKIEGFIEGTTTPTTLGNLTEAGLPDHNHYLTVARDRAGGSGNAVYGDEYWYGSYNHYSSYASQSNPIYGKSTTVQPQSIKVLYYIVTASSVVSSGVVNLDNIATDLNGKLDTNMSNLNSVDAIAKDTITGWGVPDYTRTMTVSGTSYTAPCHGLFICYVTSVAINNTTLPLQNMTVYLPVAKNDVITFTTSYSAIFTPLKGANY